MYDAEHIATLHSRVAGPEALGKCQPWILLHPQKPHFQVLQLKTGRAQTLTYPQGEDTTKITGFSVFKDQGGKNTQGKNSLYQKASLQIEERSYRKCGSETWKTWKQQPSSAGASRGLPKAAQPRPLAAAPQPRQDLSASPGHAAAAGGATSLGCAAAALAEHPSRRSSGDPHRPEPRPDGGQSVPGAAASRRDPVPRPGGHRARSRPMPANVSALLRASAPRFGAQH